MTRARLEIATYLMAALAIILGLGAAMATQPERDRRARFLRWALEGGADQAEAERAAEKELGARR